MISKITTPPIKYPGGKRFLVDKIKVLWVNSQSKRLVEPFSGGMAISLGISPKKARINDLNPHVINFYRQVQNDLKINIAMSNDKEFYYARRKEFNDLIIYGNFETPLAASLFYYLNRTCFNGLVRFNGSGLLNVPFGQYKTVNYCREFSEIRKIIRTWKFTSSDFTKVRVNKTDFLYVDPPYDTEFTNYSGQRFKWSDQLRLIKHLKKYECPIVISNQATDRIVELYKNNDYFVQYISAPRRISCNGDRKKVTEVLCLRNFKLGDQ